MPKFSKNDSVHLSEFYRAYLSNPPNKEKSPVVKDVFEKRQHFLNVVDKTFEKKGGCLREEDIAFLPHNSQQAYCQSIAAQILPTKNHEWVLPYGAYYYGFGRGCSRFLDLHPELYAQLRERYQDVDPVIMAELRSPEFFNGNTYPPLFNYAIYLPDQLNFDEGRVMPISWKDLMVSKIDEHYLGLTTSKGQTVIPIDLGFLDLRQRHPFYRLLNCFGPSTRFSLQLPWGNPQGSDVEYRPRLVFEQALILSRATWRIPLSALPIQKSKERDCEFAVRLIEWATHLNIPNQGFFRLFDPAQASFLRPVQRQGLLTSSVFHRQEKPQYYNLDNPFVVKRLRTIMKCLEKENRPIMLEIQELLPDHHPICELLVYLENK